ncbi:Hypothetical protein Tpal_1060 [Trichococcus palustris]|jgi:uncharacterized membrane protein|uniref:DUF2207 domain-containing protein n=1 Tax=Trichococcus palustris TaxID=140314 RepID=A0A143YI18_9LACT|nr:DUF2207 domain-containing protein [Trichococcus palustris]CZQ88865.1 Hypothetical protein Tpal_1060 [Trichococcus palustris]SFL00585.1 Uncharacterized membrane protein [Trichococcus palustris]
MKRIGFIFVLMFSFIFGFGERDVQARSYEITNYDVLVDIQKDGSAFFKESITYDFSGEFNGVLYDLDIKDVAVPTDVKVSMQAYSSQNAFPFALSDTGEPGTFKLENTGDFLHFTVYNKMSDEIQTVIYEYRIPEIVTNYNDIAEFNRKVIGAGWENTLNDVDVTIRLPEATGEQELRAWGHGGSQNSTVTLEKNQQVLLHVPQNPAKQFVEAHVIFPTRITADNPHIVNEDKYAAILAQEAALAETEKKNSYLWGIAGAALAIIGPILPIAVFLWNRRAKKKEMPQEIHLPDHIYELPEDMTPAVMSSAVFGRNAQAEDVSATILDLVRKGYLSISPVDVPQKGIFGREKAPVSSFRLTKLKDVADAPILSHEKQVMQWFIDDVGDGNSVTLEDIKDIADQSADAKRFNENRDTWQQQVSAVAKPKRKSYRSKYNTKAGVFAVLALIANILFLVIVIGIGITLGKVTMWTIIAAAVGVGLSFVLVGYSASRPIMTAEGERVKQEWEGFRNMLKDVGNFPMREVGSIALWDHFLVYAVSLGVADKVMKQMQIEFPVNEIQASAFGTYYYMNNAIFLSALNNSVSTGISKSMPSSSNSSGFGGGFGGGSSGGSGGGSGGGAF